MGTRPVPAYKLTRTGLSEARPDNSHSIQHLDDHHCSLPVASRIEQDLQAVNNGKDLTAVSDGIKSQGAGSTGQRNASVSREDSR